MVFILVLGFLYIFAGNSYSSSLEELGSLPYLAWSQKSATGGSGVVKYDKNKAFDGYNLYVNDSKSADLMDMNGQLVYRWKFPHPDKPWEYVRLLDRGDIIAVCFGKYLVRIDKDSKLIWEIPIGANHDIEILPDGTFLVPVYEPPVQYNKRTVRFDSIVHVSKDGRILDTWSTHDHLQELQKLYPPSYMATQLTGNSVNAGKPFGYYHLNSIQALPDTALGSKDKRFQKGNWLISFLHVDLMCILDKDTHQIVWSWGPGILDGLHMPRMLGNGNILVYDNGMRRSYSRLIIMDPVSGKIVWEYKATPPERFHSSLRGSEQLLANGDFFISESDNGRAFEITPGGQIVWEFLNPVVKKGKRKTIYRMLRVSKQDLPWLRK